MKPFSRILLACSLCLPLVVTGNSSVPGELPPDPLTLDYVLEAMNRNHPAHEKAFAKQQLAAADRFSAESITGFRLGATLVPRAVRPVAEDETVNDSYASISLEKRLYDFGYSSGRVAAAEAGQHAVSWQVLDLRQRRYLGLMQSYFDVLLADMRYTVDNEEMAHRYVSYDKARERHNLGQVSDVDLKKAESEYQAVLVRRSQSDAARSTSRSRLAVALNLTGYLPGNLQQPVLKNLDRKIPEYDALKEEVLQHNPLIKLSQAAMKAAEHEYQSTRAQYYPVISAGVKSTYWEREIGSRNSMQAGVKIDIPLYSGGSVKAEVVRARARLDNARAVFRQQQLDSHVAVLNMLERLQTAVAELRSARINLDYQDLELERRRALYEMEVQTSMGSQMTKLTEAQWQASKAEYNLELVWTELEILRGRLLAENRKAEPMDKEAK